MRGTVVKQLRRYATKAGGTMKQVKGWYRNHRDFRENLRRVDKNGWL